MDGLDEDELRGMLWALQKAKFMGVRSVTYRDRTVEYRSITDMRKAESDIKAMLGEARRPKTYGVYTRKGY